MLWSADVETSQHKIWSTVLDISPTGAKLRIDTILLGQVAKFRLAVESLGPIECAPVWQQNGRLGVRFLDGQPSMTELQNLLANPPYLPAHS
ncbi:MAG TPA: PilZ domain-containing protein [Stellaceae bacterium]|nr:PilZ domain-containing protein [Stellaceae bacterium]